MFDHRALRLLIDTMGADHVMVGSDAPFPLGEEHIGDLVRNQPNLVEGDRARILTGNAAKFFNLEYR